LHSKEDQHKDQNGFDPLPEVWSV